MSRWTGESIMEHSLSIDLMLQPLFFDCTGCADLRMPAVCGCGCQGQERMRTCTSVRDVQTAWCFELRFFFFNKEN